MDNLHHCLP